MIDATKLGEANIKYFCDELERRILEYKNDVIIDYKLDDSTYINRPLLDVTTVLRILKTLKNEILKGDQNE